MRFGVFVLILSSFPTSFRRVQYPIARGAGIFQVKDILVDEDLFSRYFFYLHSLYILFSGVYFHILLGSSGVCLISISVLGLRPVGRIVWLALFSF